MNSPEGPRDRATLGRGIMRAGVFGALVAALITLPGLGLGTLWDNSETAYSEVAREILLTGDAIVMHFNGAPWFVQPPLYFWIAAAFAHLFGVVTVAFRLPSALATIVMGAVFARFVYRHVGARAARYAAVVLSTALMQAVLGRLAVMDALLEAAVLVTTIAWYTAISAEEEDGIRASGAILGAVAAAIGVLTKGPVAVVLPLLVLIPYVLWTRLARRGERSFAAPSPLAIVLSAIAFMLIAIPWYVMLSASTGFHGTTELIMHYTFGRYLGTIENQAGPIYYYVPVFILCIFPWTAFAVPAFADAFRAKLEERRGDRTASMMRLGVVWALAPFVFFSFASTKLPSYLSDSVPGLALLCAVWLDRSVVRRRRLVALTALGTPVVVFLLGIAVVVFARTNAIGDALRALETDALLFVGALFAGAVAMFVALLRRQSAPAAPYVLGAGTIVAMLVIALRAVPDAERFKPIPPLADRIMRDRRDGDLIALQGVGGENSLMFYTRPPIAPLDSPNVPASSPRTDPTLVLCGTPRIFLVAPTQRPTPDPTYGRRRTVLAVEGKDTLFFIDGPPCRGDVR